MTKQSVIESYSWLSALSFPEKTGEKAVAIKGVALYAGAISRNLRKYSEEEVMKAARTLTGKPITVNHDSKRIIGNVEIAEYEDGALEFVGYVKDRQYVQKLRDSKKVFNKQMSPDEYFKKWGAAPLRHLSIEANYLKLKCVKCGREFTDYSEYLRHMQEVEKVKNVITEPRHIYITGVSIVESPEEPGIPDATFEILETYNTRDYMITFVKKQNGHKQLLEKLSRDIANQIKWREKMKKAKAPTISKQQSITVDQARKLAEQEKHSCPEGEKWDEEQGKCVPVSEEQEEDIKPGSHYCEEHPDDPRCIAHKKAIHGEEILEADYPWDQCVRDRMNDGYTEEQAKKICAAIKNRTIKHTMEFYGYKTVQEAIRHVAKKIEEDKLFAYNLERAAEQLQQGPPPEPTVKPPAPCPEGFVLKDGECVPKEWPEISPTAKTPAPQMTPEPAIDVAKTTVTTPAPATQGAVLEQDEGKLPPAPFPEPPPAPEEHHCPEGSHYDAEAGTCVPDETIPTEVSDLVREVKLLPKLAEPGDVPHADWSKAGYTSFDDCVSKNQDKSDPEAYCADIRRKLIGESLKETFDLEKTYIRLARLEERLSKLWQVRNRDVDALAKTVKAVAAVPSALKAHSLAESAIRAKYDAYSMRYTQKALSEFHKVLRELLNYTRNIADYTKANLGKLATASSRQCSSITVLKENVEALEKAHNELVEWRKEFDNVLKGLDAKMLNEIKTLGEETSKLKEQLKEKDTKIAELEDKLKEKVEKTVKETAEIRTELDNFKSKLTGNFKGHNPIVVKETADVTIGDPAKEMRETARKKRR